MAVGAGQFFQGVAGGIKGLPEAVLAWDQQDSQRQMFDLELALRKEAQRIQTEQFSQTHGLAERELAAKEPGIVAQTRLTAAQADQAEQETSFAKDTQPLRLRGLTANTSKAESEATAEAFKARPEYLQQELEGRSLGLKVQREALTRSQVDRKLAEFDLAVKKESDPVRLGRLARERGELENRRLEIELENLKNISPIQIEGAKAQTALTQAQTEQIKNEPQLRQQQWTLDLMAAATKHGWEKTAEFETMKYMAGVNEKLQDQKLRGDILATFNTALAGGQITSPQMKKLISQFNDSAVQMMASATGAQAIILSAGGPDALKKADDISKMVGGLLQVKDPAEAIKQATQLTQRFQQEAQDAVDASKEATRAVTTPAAASQYESPVMVNSVDAGVDEARLASTLRKQRFNPNVAQIKDVSDGDKVAAEYNRDLFSKKDGPPLIVYDTFAEAFTTLPSSEVVSEGLSGQASEDAKTLLRFLQWGPFDKYQATTADWRSQFFAGKSPAERLAAMWSAADRQGWSGASALRKEAENISEMIRFLVEVSGSPSQSFGSQFTRSNTLR